MDLVKIDSGGWALRFCGRRSGAFLESNRAPFFLPHVMHINYLQNSPNLAILGSLQKD